MTGTALTKPAPATLVAQYSNDFATVLPSHIKAETWVRLAQGALRQNQKLAEAATRNPGSLLTALLEAARQGLTPGTEEFYLVPYGSEVQGIRGYQGEIELMYRAGAISSVIVEVVRKNDSFSYRPGRDERPNHEIDWDAEDRGPLRLVYAYAVMKDGATSKVVVLNKAKIAEARAMAKGASRADSPWNKHEEAMWMKTAAHRLSKWVPTSAEYIREQLRAVRDVAAEQPYHQPSQQQQQHAGREVIDIHDAEVIEDVPSDFPNDEYSDTLPVENGEGQ